MPFTLSASELAPAAVEALEQCPRDSETGEMLLPMELLATLFIQRSMTTAKPEAVGGGDRRRGEKRRGFEARDWYRGRRGISFDTIRKLAGRCHHIPETGRL